MNFKEAAHLSDMNSKKYKILKTGLSKILVVKMADL
jgi:hypothetical protein